MEVELDARDCRGHITDETTEPPVTDPNLLRWRQEDVRVLSWILQNLEPRLMNSVARYRTAKALWDALAVTYGSGGDAFQIYDLHSEASRQTQGERTLEEYWNALQSLWLAIDDRRPNPMKCDGDRAEHNRITEENRLFNFLSGLNSQFDAVRREILRMDPLPTVESGYSAVRKEAGRLRILAGSSEGDQKSGGIGVGLTSRRTPDRQQGWNHRGHPDPESRMTRTSGDKAKLRCSYCNLTGHTKETCFKLHGYPEWFEGRTGKLRNGKAAVVVEGSDATSSSDGKGEADANGQKDGKRGFAAIGIGSSSGSGRGEGSGEGNPVLDLGFRPFYTPEINGYCSPVPPCQNICNSGPSACRNFISGPSVSEKGNPVPSVGRHARFGPDSSGLYDSDPAGCNVVSQTLIKDKAWIFDCGATDTMTYDPEDVMDRVSTRKTEIHTANGGISRVEGAGMVEISEKIKLKCLYVPSLACKLLSISQVTRDLNCRVLMYPTFCLLQDICTKEIVGRGTERGGLYVVDEVAQQGVARLAHGTSERELWLWHRRLGHPSLGYLKLLFPTLCSNNTELNCETCILAKSHRTTFSPSNTRAETIFSLVHSDV